MDNNLDNLKEQIRNIYDNILALQVPEKEDNSALMQKIDELLSNTQNIIQQNEKIVSQNENIISLIKDLAKKQVTMETQTAEIKVEKQPTEEPKEELPIFDLSQDNLGQISETTEEPKPEETIEPAEPVKEEIHEEKKTEKTETSSVLEFLHKRVIKDKPTSESKDNGKANTATSSLNSLFADTDAEKTKEQQENTSSLFYTKEENQTTELFSEKQESIGDRFASQTKNDLRIAIGINYKFMFINDLFSGDIKEYENFINKLNETASFKDSMEVINENRLSYKWATTSPAYANLVDIIQKRFE